MQLRFTLWLSVHDHIMIRLIPDVSH